MEIKTKYNEESTKMNKIRRYLERKKLGQRNMMRNV
jgi:hypothetical protein